MTTPYLTTDQMREVDRMMMETYGIGLIQMMENAGRNLAHLARTRFLNGDPREREIVILAGRGGNGGGGLVCARRLHNWGAAVRVFLTHPDDDVVGELYLADISVPPDLYARPGLNLEVGPVFSHDDIIRLK